MTPEQLDEIEKLAEAATPGPWRAQLSDKGHALWGPLPNGECGSMRIALSSYAAFDRANMLFVEALRDAALPLVKELREAWEALDEREGDMHARIRAGYDKAVADSWRAHCAKIEKERDEARAEVERLKESVANLDALYVSRTDALRESEAEVERLRAALRLLWEEATDEERCANERAPGCYSHTFSQPCRKAVEAALKENT